MDVIEPLLGTSAEDEHTPAIDAVIAVKDFHAASKRGRFDQEQERSNSRHHPAQPEDDNVILSDVANVSLLEEQGFSPTAIATNLGLTPADVLADLQIADQICHPSGTQPLGS